MEFTALVKGLLPVAIMLCFFLDSTNGCIGPVNSGSGGSGSSANSDSCDRFDPTYDPAARKKREDTTFKTVYSNKVASTMSSAFNVGYGNRKKRSPKARVQQEAKVVSSVKKATNKRKKRTPVQRQTRKVKAISKLARRNAFVSKLRSLQKRNVQRRAKRQPISKARVQSWFIGKSRVKRQSQAVQTIADDINAGIADGSVTDYRDIEVACIKAFIDPSSSTYTFLRETKLSEALTVVQQVIPLLQNILTLSDDTNVLQRYGYASGTPTGPPANLGAGITITGDDDAAKVGNYLDQRMASGDVTNFLLLMSDLVNGAINADNPINAILRELNGEEVVGLFTEMYAKNTVSADLLRGLSDDEAVVTAYDLQVETDNYLAIGTDSGTVTLDVNQPSQAMLAIQQIASIAGATDIASVKAAFRANTIVSGLSSADLDSLLNLAIDGTNDVFIAELDGTAEFQSLFVQNAGAFAGGMATESSSFATQINEFLETNSFTTIDEVAEILLSLEGEGLLGDLEGVDIPTLLATSIQSGSSTTLAGLTRAAEYATSVVEGTVAITSGGGLAGIDGEAAATKIEQFMADNEGEFTDVASLVEKLEEVRQGGGLGDISAEELEVLVANAVRSGGSPALNALSGVDEFANSQVDSESLSGGIDINDIAGSTAKLEEFITANYITDADNLIELLVTAAAEGSGPLAGMTEDQIRQVVAKSFNNGAGSATFRDLTGLAAVADSTTVTNAVEGDALSASDLTASQTAIEQFILDNGIDSASDLLDQLQAAFPNGEFSKEVLTQIISDIANSGSSSVISGLTGIAAVVSTAANKASLSTEGLSTSDTATLTQTIEQFVSDNGITDGDTLLAKLEAAVASGEFGEFAQEDVRELIAIAEKESSVIQGLTGISSVTESAVITTAFTAQSSVFSITELSASITTMNAFISDNSYTTAQLSYTSYLSVQSRGKISQTVIEAKQLFLEMAWESTSTLFSFSDIASLRTTLTAELYAGAAAGESRFCKQWGSGKAQSNGSGGSWNGVNWSSA